MNDWVDTLVVGVRYAVDDASIDKAMGSFNRVGSLLASGAAAIMATGAALTGMAISQAIAQDETAKLAGTLRTSTEELTALQYAAERSGLPLNVLEESMRRLVMSSTTAAQNGASPLAQAFRDLGVDAEGLDGKLKSPAQLIPEIAAGLEGIADDARRSEIMLTLFGESSARLEGFLGQGAAGINALTARARELGVVLDSEAAANSEALADAMLDLKGVLGLVGRSIGDTIIPHVTDAAMAFTDWFTATDNWLRLGIDKGVDALAWSLDQLHTPLGAAVAGGIAFVGTAATMVKAAGAISTAFQAMGISVSFGVWPITAAGAALAAGMAVLAAGGAVLYGVIDEITTTAEGGDTVLRRMYDGLGLGEELARAMAAGLSIMGDVGSIAFTALSEGAQMIWDDIKGLGKSIENAIGWVADLASEVAESVPMIEPLAELLTSMSEGLAALTKGNVGSWVRALEGVAGFTGRFAEGQLEDDERGVAGALGIGRLAAGMEAASIREGRGVGTTRGERGALRQRYFDAGDDFKASGRAAIIDGFRGMFSASNPAVPPSMTSGSQSVNVAPSVSVSVNGSSPMDVARAAAEQVRRSVYDQLSEVEGMQ